jgi:antitoxin CcdA
MSHALSAGAMCAKHAHEAMQVPAMNKRATNLTIDPALLDEARSLGINLSATFEASLREAVRSRKAAQWLQDNRAAIDGYNSWIAENGLPLTIHRQF